MSTEREELMRIAAEYEAGTAKAIASGYEEFGPDFQRERKLVIDTLRNAAQGHHVPGQPTEAMLIAARDWSRKKYGTPIGNDAAAGCWRAMYDASSVPSQNGETP